MRTTKEGIGRGVYVTEGKVGKAEKVEGSSAAVGRHKCAKQTSAVCCYLVCLHHFINQKETVSKGCRLI